MGGRNTAIILVSTILGAEMLLSGKLQAIWKALWSGPYPLGKGMTATASSSGTVDQGSGGKLK